MFPYQIIHGTSQEFLSIAVDRYLSWITLDFPSIKKQNKKGVNARKYIFYCITITKTFTRVFLCMCFLIREWSHTPSYMFPFIITKRLYNNHKDFHRISFKKRYNSPRCVFPLSDSFLTNFPSIKKSR